MAKTPKRVPLAIYRLKGATAGTGFSDVVSPNRTDVTSEQADLGEGVSAKLFVRVAKPDYPKWAEFLRGAVPNVSELLKKHAANSAVLAIGLGRVRYAFAFGYGSTLIDSACIDRGFGLRCALDLIDPDSLVSVGYKQVDYTTIFTSVQANKRVRFDEFRVDTDAAVLHGVFGRPAARDVYYTKALGGDALHINPAIEVTELPDLMRWVEKIRTKKGYLSAGYDWIDRVRITRDESIIEQLEARLDAELDKKRPAVQVGPPEAIDYRTIDCFKIVGAGKASFDDIVLDDLFRARKSKGLTAEVLRAVQIIGVDENDTELIKWRAYRWLVWSCKLGGKSYVLQDGQFYEVDASFEAKIDNFLDKRLKKLPRGWPDWAQADDKKREADFNRQLAEHFGSRKALLLDNVDFYKSFRGQGKIEFCDVFLKGTPSFLVCSKKYYGSAELSHLFAQGANSAETLVADSDLRSELRDYKGLKSSIPALTPATHRFGVAYVILTRERRRKLSSLPFFSKLTLYRYAKQLLQSGFDVRAGTRAIKPV